MKKTINISIGGLSFQIEEDAYSELDGYLSRVKQHFANRTESEEIISDIEDRIADLLSVKLTGGKIITLPLVEELVSVMGQPEEIAGEKPSEKTETTDSSTNEFNATSKRLFRNPENAILGGVASGLAAYFGNVDPVWVRLIFVILTLVSGFGIIIYLILWLIVPEAKSGAEKMQMRGEPINLKNVEAMVKERVEEFKKKDKSKLSRALAVPFVVLGKIIRTLVPALLRVLGAVIAIAGALALAGITFLAISLVLNGNSPYVDFPLREIATGGVYYLAIASAYFVAFVPVMLITLVGTSLLAFKSTFSKMGSVGMLALWIVASAIALNLAIKLAPQIENVYNNSQTYQVQSMEIGAKDFTTINLTSDYEAIVHKADEYKVVASGRAQDLQELQTYVENSKFVAVRNSNLKFCVFCFRRPVKLEIFTPGLSAIDLSGATEIVLDGFEATEFKAKLSGASKAELGLAATTFNAELSGASKIVLNGKADSLNLKESGASQFLADRADIKIVNAELSGASKAYFGNLESLAVKASGASKVYYFSTVKITEELSGASRAEVSPSLERN